MGMGRGWRKPGKDLDGVQAGAPFTPYPPCPSCGVALHLRGPGAHSVSILHLWAGGGQTCSHPGPEATQGSGADKTVTWDLGWDSLSEGRPQQSAGLMVIRCPMCGSKQEGPVSCGWREE